MGGKVITVTNKKGGVGKTTTAVNLSHALALQDERVLVIDLDPQGNTTRGLGIQFESIEKSIGDLIMDRQMPIERVIYRGPGLDLIPATPTLSAIGAQMFGIHCSELRLAQRLNEIRERYSYIVIDAPPSSGKLTVAAWSAADSVLIPVDCSFFGMMGIKELLAELELIKQGTNPQLEILGYLLTMFDRTRMSSEVADALIAEFGDLVFETRIRKSVRLKEAPAYGVTIFNHSSESSGAEDYLALADEVMGRISIPVSSVNTEQTLVSAFNV